MLIEALDNSETEGNTSHQLIRVPAMNALARYIHAKEIDAAYIAQVLDTADYTSVFDELNQALADRDDALNFSFALSDRNKYIVKQAEVKANEILKDAKKELKHLNQEIEMRKKQLAPKPEPQPKPKPTQELEFAPGM